MEWWLAAVGAAFGVIGGMGLGGGVVLIPALTLLFGFGQHEAQALCLLCFLPMSACALFFILKRSALNLRKRLSPQLRARQARIWAR